MEYFTPTKLSENIRETPEGFLLCIGVPIARTGTMVYADGEIPLKAGDDGRITISRSPEDVFDKDAMASFEGKPVTINHPQDFVDPANWGDLAKGHMHNIRQGDEDWSDHLIADLLITDELAIALVKAGLREVSCGYDAEYIQTGKGTGIQKSFIGNHLALVEKGRAGITCAINDHKGKGLSMSEIGKKLKKILGRAVDEAIKEDEKVEKKEEKSKDASSYDELVQMCKDLGEKIAAMSGGNKEEKSSEDDSIEKDDKKDEKMAKKDDGKGEDEPEVAPSVEDRLKALETAMSKLLEGQAEESSEDEEMEESDEAEESEDNMEEMESDEAEESEDNMEEMESMTGDTAARAEILAPGIKKTKDVKVKALKVAYDTKEGKEVITALNGGKVPTFDSAEKVDMLFIAASELLKTSRSKELSKTKTVKSFDSENDGTGTKVTPERMNEINAAHWNKK